jgi:hypothetical protein
LFAFVSAVWLGVFIPALMVVLIAALIALFGGSSVF